ncbi:MATE family efflux transporter [Chitinimonas koreensis]|uniref:MATE family efflux transporter n=1 Tax=Chitinimonas koreensis TaxID=356302 RepID=UPI0004275C2A|nr:MATE family efflux transporter [Chitinimonas koreensis]QNM97872.1 MATE family efflux transporter [Chitinimonas koreensis]
MPLRFFRSPAVRTETAALWRLAWPMLIGQLAAVGMAVADVAMAGHASANDLAAVSLGASVWSIVIVTLMGVMMSVNPTVAHHVGAEEYHRIPHLVRQALWKALGIGLLAFVAANACALVFDGMKLEPEVREMAKRFLHVVSFALPAFSCYRVLYGYSASLNQVKPMMVIALAALALNIVLNWVLIYGHFGLPRMGGLGCAVATLVCVWFNLLALLAWMRRAPAYRRTWPLDRWEGPHWREIRTLLKIGLPIGVTYFAESSAFGLIALLVAEFGAAQVAAHQIALNFSSLVFMLPLSLGVALITRIGHALGEGDPAAARFRAWVGVGLSFGFAILSASFIALFNRQIAAAYTSDAAVAALAAHLLVFAAVFQLSDATQVSTSCAIRGYKVTRPPMVIHMTAFWGFSLPLGCVLGLAPSWLPWRPAAPMAAEGFWIALVVGLTVAAGGLTWFLDHLSRKRLAGPAPLDQARMANRAA